MNGTSTQKRSTIGNPNRFCIDSEGNVQWFDTLRR